MSDSDVTSSTSREDDTEVSTSGSESEPEHEQPGPSVPFEQLVQERQSGIAGPSNRGMAGGAGKHGRDSKAARRSFKRENKNRPQELSSRRPVPRFREVIEAPKAIYKDPRFDDMVGNLDTDKFAKRYSFLYNEQLPQEKSNLKAALKKTKDSDYRKKLEVKVAQLEQQIKGEQARKKQVGVKKDLKAKEKEAVKTGKRPFYLKRSETKKLELIAKYEQLKEAGGLEKYLTKRRKRNAAKDHRYVPAERRNQ